MSEDLETGRPKRKYVRRAPYKKVTAKKAAPAPEAERPESTRPPMRKEMRGNADLERARQRMVELEDVDPDERPDPFALPPGIEPPGWGYEWKKHTVFNQEDPAYNVNLARRGWEPVDASRHPELMPAGYRGVIERDGLRLYERPTEFNDRAKMAEHRKALKQVRDKEVSLGLAPEGQFERRDLKIRRSMETIAIPESGPTDS